MSYVIEKAAVPANRARIELTDPVEVRWWCRCLACSPKQLMEAVARVGNSAACVEQLIDSWCGFRPPVRVGSYADS